MPELGECYVYQKQTDWSLFQYGFAIPLQYQVVFSGIAHRFLQRGESKAIRVYLNGKRYDAKIKNLNIDERHKRQTDILQVRYTAGSDLAMALRSCFARSYQYLYSAKMQQSSGSKKHILVPEEYKEYLAIYTTVEDDSYVFEAILSDEVSALKQIVSGKQERTLETEFDFNDQDADAGIVTDQRIVKIRKLNRKIGENLKLLYGYRCQLCGQIIGEEFGSHIVEAHHIDYFVNSMNNDASNQMIVCPNHHSIIHDANPVFDRHRLIYLYANGFEQGLVLNKHL